MLAPLRLDCPHVTIRRIGEQHLRTLRAWNIERLRRAGGGHRLQCCLFTDGGEWNMLAFEYKRSMDLIIENAHIVLRCQIA